jgi:IclR family pca regulon transcriptional regulator
MTLTEVAERAGMNRAAARRFLLTLVKEGYAESEGRNFSLRPKVLELGRSVIPTMTFADLAQPLLDDLATELDETCYVSVLDDQSVVYILRASGKRLIGVNLEVGSRMPAWLMSSGRVLAAALAPDERDSWLAGVKLERRTEKTVRTKAGLAREIKRVGRQGWSVVDEEYEIGMRSLSVPVQDRHGTAFAALNVTCPSSRVSVEQMNGDFLQALQVFSTRLSEAMPSDRLLPGLTPSGDPTSISQITPR